ncbi:ROK family protein [Caulobacter sp. NIBR1757]|uniref:ROK family protein n=1 Tax=Caulobacter sp. NIBR1757 TaxID=3016000 RepID=UPI0022F12810|nr:ROK family protein [Caulobacter sp. NIBR1757]WGM40055.1 Putative fructokinase [Caulobacter sp. NIBR1757]
MTRLFAAIETGGTKIVCRVTGADGRQVGETRLPTTTPQAAFAELTEAIAGMIGDRPLAAIGIASFGPIRIDPAAPDYGAMLATSKPGWSGFNLVAALKPHFDVPIAIDTDVGAAALAEQAMGAGQGARAVAYVTIGTGIGGGLAQDGVTLKGALHPEIGHLPVRRVPGDDIASRCPFHASCAEGLAAGPAVGARLAPGERLADRPDVAALVTDYLGQLCASLVMAWSPDRIVLGGGVMTGSGLAPAIAGHMLAEIGDYGVADAVRRPGFLVPAALEHAGLEGALILARQADGRVTT